MNFTILILEQKKSELLTFQKMYNNPYYQSKMSPSHILISLDDQNKQQIHLQENANMSSLQIMINPNVKNEELNNHKKHIEYLEGKPNINSTNDINIKIMINIDELSYLLILITKIEL